MAYKTILVHVDLTQRAAERVSLAAQLALSENAHLIGTAMTGWPPFVFTGRGLDPALPALMAPLDQLCMEADAALDAFEAQARAIGVPSYERRRIDDEPGPGVSMQARYCDLVVLGQADRAAPAPRLRPDFPEYVMLNCARPVLLVPAGAHLGQFGRKVVVGWNGSMEASRAITSAIPLLRRANQVDLMIFNPEFEGDIHGPLPGADMGLYLARHGVRVEVRARAASVDAGSAMLAHALDAGADMIVAGAYGHSRVREVMLGGATRSLVRSSTLPVWMAH